MTNAGLQRGGRSRAVFRCNVLPLRGARVVKTKDDMAGASTDDACQRVLLRFNGSTGIAGSRPRKKANVVKIQYFTWVNNCLYSGQICGYPRAFIDGTTNASVPLIAQ